MNSLGTEATELGVTGAELREVEGPSALGGGRRRFLDLLWLISVTEFRRTYHGTVLGLFWSVLRPLMTFGVLAFVFTKFLRVGSAIPHYPMVLLLNIVLFGFFQQATQISVNSVVAQEGVVRKTQFPRLVIPLSTVLTTAFSLGFNLIIVFVFILAFGVNPTWTWFLFPVALALIFLFTAAISMALSALFVRFRDISNIWESATQALYFVSPILYPISFIPAVYHRLLLLNPLAVIFNEIQVWVINPGEPTSASLAGGVVWLLPALAIFIAVCVFGIWIFNREAPRIAEDL